MNILHLHPELNLTCGITKTIYLISGKLNDEFHHHIITLGGDAIDKFVDSKIMVTEINLKRNSMISSLKIFFKIYNYCKRNKINIIHSYHRYFDLLAFLISKLYSVKTITSVQSKVIGQKLFSYNADMLIAPSNNIMLHLEKYFNINGSKIVVISNFVDQEELKIYVGKNELKSELNIPQNSFVIGFIGRFSVKEKGIDILLGACQNLYRNHPNTYLILVGNGEDKIFVEEYLKVHSIPVKVIPPQKQIFDYYNICNLVVLPSRIEPFGIVVIEAGLMKLPVIGSNVDGIAEIIEDNVDGLLFEPDNIQDLTDKLKVLISDNNKAIFLANNLFEKVSKFYTADKIIPKYRDLYNQKD